MSKKIVICCDGTANQFGPNNTNVVKLYQTLRQDSDSQVKFYDPGLGTFSVKPVISKVGANIYKFFGLAFGLGLSQNILEAYSFIMKNYEPGDQLFLVGFSRGAYTIRALAGMILRCGILSPDSDHLLPYAFDLYSNVSKNRNKARRNRAFKVLGQFNETFAQPIPKETFPIHFLGLWDTVKSVGRIYDPFQIPNTRKNGYVKFVRHALSIDERRGFFRPNAWSNEERKEGQDFKQVWFAGDHSDVGGGHTEIGLSQITLEWMLVEAHHAGLELNPIQIKKIFRISPDHKGKQHSSLGRYLPTEIIPKLEHNEDGGWRYRPYVNLARRRQLDAELDPVVVHQSVIQRLEETDYAPPNLPPRDQLSIEPWIEWTQLAP